MEHLLIKHRSNEDLTRTHFLSEIHLINPWLLGEEYKPLIIRDAGGAPWQALQKHGGQARGTN